MGANGANAQPYPGRLSRHGAYEPLRSSFRPRRRTLGRLGALFEVAFLTGLRRGELVGLRWDAVDLTERVMRVQNARVQASGGVIEGAPKTEKSRRVVTLDAAAVGALMAWPLRQAADRDEWGELWIDSGYAFTGESGAPIKPDYPTRVFEKLRKAAGLPKITLRGARHEHASLWIEGGGDITLLSKRLGHASSRITADIYTHRVGDADRAAAEQVAAMIPRVHTLHTQVQSGGEEEAPESATSA